MTIKNLIELIDLQTNNDAVYPRKSGKEEIKKKGVALIYSFSTDDWLTLYALNLKEKSNLWVEHLTHILDAAHTEQARQMMIHIALTGTEENFFAAMKCIRKFKRDVSIYSWMKLENRSSRLSSRYNNKSNNS